MYMYIMSIVHWYLYSLRKQQRWWQRWLETEQRQRCSAPQLHRRSCLFPIRRNLCVFLITSFSFQIHATHIYYFLQGDWITVIWTCLTNSERTEKLSTRSTSTTHSSRHSSRTWWRLRHRKSWITRTHSATIYVSASSICCSHVSSLKLWPYFLLCRVPSFHVHVPFILFIRRRSIVCWPNTEWVGKHGRWQPNSE